MRNAGVKNNDGQALVLVMMVLAALFMLTASLGIITSHTRGNITREQSFTRALYAAEMGLEKTMAKAINDVQWFNGLTQGVKTTVPVTIDPQLAGELSFTVTATKQGRATGQIFGTPVLLESVGRSLDSQGNPAAQKTLQSTLLVFTAEDYFKGFSILPEEPVQMEIKGNATFDTPFIYNGDLTLGGSVSVTGTNPVYTTGGLQLSGNASCGTSITGYPYIPPFPDLVAGYYEQKAGEDGLDHVYSSGASGTTFVFPNSNVGTNTITIAQNKNKTEEITVYVYNGFYYVDGNVTISGMYQGNAVIFATGDINVASDLTPVNDSGQADPTAGSLTLIALGDAVIENSTVYANLMAGGIFQAWGNAWLYGAVCATGANFGGGHGGGSQGGGGGNFDMEFTSDLAPQDNYVPVTAKIINWQELYPVFSSPNN